MIERRKGLKYCVNCGCDAEMIVTDGGEYLARCTNPKCENHNTRQYKSKYKGDVTDWWNGALPLCYGECSHNPNPFDFWER